MESVNFSRQNKGLSTGQLIHDIQICLANETEEEMDMTEVSILLLVLSTYLIKDDGDLIDEKNQKISPKLW